MSALALEPAESRSAPTEPVQPSSHPGMGAVPHADGTTFRVWAPHAAAVAVVGSFNGWSADADPLAPEEGGYWSADVPGAAPGAEYKLVITTADGGTLHRIDPYARQVIHSDGNAVVYDEEAFDWADDAYSPPPHHELVLYEMHAGTFHDKTPEDGAPGTLDDAGEGLDYLRDLGVTTVCLMPLAEFPGDRSWGYNPAHPFAVESAYGGPDALKRFVKAAHARGLGVVLDVVYNHFGPTDIDLWRFDGWSENDRGGIYFYNDERAGTPWGETRPDYGRPEVRRYIRDNALSWLESYRADGLRFDGTVFIRRTTFDGGTELPDGWGLLQEITAEVRARMPEKLLIAEDLQREDAIVMPPEDGGAGFHAQWDTEFVYPLRDKVLIPADDAARDVDAAVHALGNRYAGDAFARLVFVDSHDNAANGSARLAAEIDPDGGFSPVAQRRAALAAVLTLTAPGIPMLFQGQEILTAGWFSDTEALDWTQLGARGGLLQLHRDLVGLRRNLGGSTRGLAGEHVDVFHVDRVEKILAYHRWADGGPGDSTVVVVNLQNRAHEVYGIPLPRDGAWQVRFNSDWRGYSEAFSDLGPAVVEAVAADEGTPRATLALGPYSALVLSQD